ncbi:RNA-directed DNA polymerase, eukaryota [Tanacetum coccineum]|uniref:RNA-directed DNA polymerase, eukaryota n=1 Tax=Tanacetum coccineum TaxID=301880 RepID=A0ABQ5AKH2_9ASTR
MGSIDLSSVRSCWGNSNFDYVHSDSVGNSGGILCIWDPNSFRRSSFTRSDYFVIVRGVWLKSGIDLMIVVVYAPQEAKEKRMLWDYLAHVSNQWVGKLVMMGDFNEVRYKSDRYGSNFNAHDAEIFNSFIYNAGLDEVPLGGSAYTWCLKSASKMSKLDRFFVSENLLSMCPNITAITLERFISDHRPILLREVRYDYGPIPFRFYRYWLEVDGFDKLVRDSWNVAPVNKKNAIRNFMGKLKFLKDRIRSWLSIHRSNSRGEIYFLKEELRSCDEVIDKGDCSNEVVHKRTEILNKIHQVNNIQASEIAQKAKIKWAIEGDENVKFFHGMLNKKRNQSNIRGIMVNGTWVDDPVQVNVNSLNIFGVVGVLGDLVNEVQSAFVANRQILDGPFILDEVLQWCRRKKKHALIFNSDFEKAFDSVHWDFMDDVLNKFGFSERWRTWIQSCLRSSRGSILVNGSPTEEFQIFRGLKHGYLWRTGNLNKVVSGGSANAADIDISRNLGKWENTRFWLDNWYEGGVIKELFPRMFALELNKNATTLESDGVLSVAAILQKGRFMGNRFQDVSLRIGGFKSVPIKVLRKISSGWILGLFGFVNSYKELASFGWFSFRIQSELQGVLVGVITMVCGVYVELSQQAFCLIRRSLKRR